ncbi:MAG: Flp pilus assembly complex ATPase component TadA, partial [Candidatus Omnitrophota bacterium]
MARKKFTDYILEKKLLSKEELKKALAIQKAKGLSLVEVLVKLGYVQEQQILTVLAGYLSIPPIRVLNLSIAGEVLNLIPETVAQKYKVLPIGKMGNTLTVAMADPLDILVIDDLKKITKCEINPVIALLSEIQQAISNYYTRISKESLEEIVKGQKPQNLEVIRTEEEEVSEDEIVRFLEDAPVIKFTGYLFKKAVGDFASDILIEPLESISRVRFRVDGILREADNFPKKMHPFVVSRIKVMCNLNIAEHRLPQEGRFRNKILNRDIDFRVSILPSSLGEKVVLRVLDKTAALLDL